jgi:hypothetical protein
MISIKNIQDAFYGYAIHSKRELLGSWERLTNDRKDEINDATLKFQENLEDVCSIIKQQLNNYPLTKKYFEKLINIRINQDNLLNSDFLYSIISDNSNFEQRTERVQNRVKNFDRISDGYSSSPNNQSGDETDEVILDLWNEVFTLDFLLNELNPPYTSLEKVLRPKDKKQVDFMGQHEGKRCCIEVTRIRKRDFLGETLPGDFNDIYRPKNIDILHKALEGKFEKKNKQIQGFCEGEKDLFDKRILIIKTSQWEYQDAHEVVYGICKNLMASGIYKSIDEVMVIYDTENCFWIT